MASELRVNTLKDASGNNSVGMAYVAGGSAKAWLNRNTSTDSTISSFNTASVTDVGTGILELNTTSAFNAAHEWSAQCTSGASGYNTSYYPDNITASKIGMRVRNDSLSYTDTAYNMMTVVGDLA